MTDLSRIEKVNDQDVVDSRLIAEELGIKHAQFYRTIKENEIEMEQDFGSICFENETRKRTIGAVVEKYAYLDEDQAMYLMTLSRNTPKVKSLKRKLVKSFSQAKKIITQQSEDIEKLKLQLEISKMDNSTAKLNNSTISLQSVFLSKCDSIADTHGKEMVAIILGKSDAIMPVTVKTTETIVCKDNKTVDFEGVTAKEVGLRLGFKTGVALINWLKAHNAGHLVSSGLRAVHADYIAPENLKAIYQLFAENKDRQLLLGE